MLKHYESFFISKHAQVICLIELRSSHHVYSLSQITVRRDLAPMGGTSTKPSHADLVGSADALFLLSSNQFHELCRGRLVTAPQGPPSGHDEVGLLSLVGVAAAVWPVSDSQVSTPEKWVVARHEKKYT